MSIAGEVVALAITRWDPDAGPTFRAYCVMRTQWALVDAIRHHYGRLPHQRRTFEALGDFDRPTSDPEDRTDSVAFLDSLPILYRAVADGLLTGATRAEIAEPLGLSPAQVRRMEPHIRRRLTAWRAGKP